jgi:hypothetical protein
VLLDVEGPSFDLLLRWERERGFCLRDWEFGLGSFGFDCAGQETTSLSRRMKESERAIKPRTFGSKSQSRRRFIPLHVSCDLVSSMQGFDRRYAETRGRMNGLLVLFAPSHPTHDTRYYKAADHTPSTDPKKEKATGCPHAISSDFLLVTI